MLHDAKLLGTFVPSERPVTKYSPFSYRFIDISADVRVECVQSGKQLLISKPELCSDISGVLFLNFVLS